MQTGRRGGGGRKKKARGGTSECSQKMAHYEWWEREQRRAAAVAAVSVFNLEPGERLCFLCWDSCAFLGFVQEEGEKEGVGAVGR